MLFVSAEAHAKQQDLNDNSLSIVGTMINGETGSDWDIYIAGDTFWISQKNLQEHFDLEISGAPPNPLSVRSSLGNINIPISETAVHPTDGLFLSTKTLRNKLNIRSEFSDENYSLHFDVPWSSGETGKQQTQRIIDHHPPPGTLRSIYYENQLRMSASGSQESDNQLLTTGSAGNGLWLLSFTEAENNQIIAENYHWSVNTNNSLLRIGTNQAEISPLTPQFEFTGLQYAWSSSGIQKFITADHSLDLDGFLSDDVRLLKTIKRDDGHPAGIALLKIDGHRVTAVRIGLDGQYEFKNIVYDTDHYQKVSIHIYESSASRKPIKIINVSQHAARRMLDQGEHFLRLGFGSMGNPAANDQAGLQRFMLYRFGVSDRLTFHFGTQSNSSAETSGNAEIAGILASLGDHWALQAEYAAQKNSNSLTASLSGDYHDFNTKLTTKIYQKDYGDAQPVTGQNHDARWRTFWRVHPQLKLGLYGRHWQETSGTDQRYLLPAVFGNITDRFSFYARPEENGDYQLSANYHFKNHRFQATHVFDAYSLIRHTIYDNQWRTWHIVAERNLTPGSDTQITTQLDWYPTKNDQNFVEMGFTHSETKKGVFFSWNTFTRPGIDIQLQYENYSYFNAEPSPSLWLRTRLNLVKSGNKYIPTEDRLHNLHYGTISGKLIDASGEKMNLNGVTMRVDGKAFPEQATSGRYTINNLKPGIYEVSVDEDDLPIELAPKKRSAVVEVKASAVTNVDFRIDEYYGFAGYVSRNDKPLGNVALFVTGDTSQFEKEIASDRFGYYRIDDLPPGHYSVRVSGQSNQAISVTLTDDFLFDQNIQLK